MQTGIRYICCVPDISGGIMAFCPNCGSSVDGRFCAKCGTAVAGQGPGGTSSPTGATTSAGLTDNVASALCYLVGFITGILFLVLEPYNRNREVRFHAFQSIFFNVAVVALSIALTIITMILPWFLGAMISLLSLILWLGILGVWIYLMVKAFSGQKVVLPVIGPMAEKQA
jgi:uncharacterized membrane protein